MAEIKPNLLIIYSKNPDEIFNRKSAIGSYVFSLAETLRENFNVYLNNRSFEESLKMTGAYVSMPAGKNAQRIKKIIPKKIKSWIRDRKHLKSLDVLTSSILALNIRFDVILEFYNFGSRVGLQLSNNYESGLVLIYDGPVLEEYHFFNGHKTWFGKVCLENQKKTFERASKIVVYSEPMRDYCCTNILNQPDRYAFHQNIDFSRFRFMDDEKTGNGAINICFVGSFLKWHRVKELIRIFHELYPNPVQDSPSLYLVGDGAEKKESEDYAKALNNPNIHFTGFLDGNELLNLQMKMDIGIMPGSNWYGAPNKIFEYGAQKMACIAPATPTIRYLFQNGEVLLFEPGNFDELKEHIRNLLQDANLRTTTSNRLYQFMRDNYSQSKTKTFYTGLLMDALSHKSQKSAGL